MEIKLKTLTPLWTGGADQTCDRVHETGIIGSLRWWYEALVRGLGGSACDPTDSKCQDREHCVACELFGCTGSKRKFRLEVHYDLQALRKREGLRAGAELKLYLTELKPIAVEERWLLAKSIEVACKYGAIGGKKTLKPQQNQAVGKDLGLLELKQNVAHAPLRLDQVRKFCERFRRSKTLEWPNLQWFFFVPGRCLWRKQMNTLMGLDEKGNPLPHRTELQLFLSGTRASKSKTREDKSKKLFSFEKAGGRIWGYVDDGQKLAEVKKQLHQKFDIPQQVILDGSQLVEQWR
ncbi:MAG TPA: type III-B CRISPR module RAMP protein Cmr1 [Candidatus Fraserbacteria bacterium]|nr:type III-B CRISPR module RAMP protein Cmr1 [Candidatus Fraserbacteria bacterium]